MGATFIGGLGNLKFKKRYKKPEFPYALGTNVRKFMTICTSCQTQGASRSKKCKFCGSTKLIKCAIDDFVPVLDLLKQGEDPEEIQMLV